MKKITIAIIVLVWCCIAHAETVFEAAGTSMAGWIAQWHSTTSKDTVAPVWASDGSSIVGKAFYSEYHDAELGGIIFNTNAFTMKVGDVATLTMDFEGQGIAASDHLNHWWFIFGFRTGGVEPWLSGDLAATATVTTGIGANYPNGFMLWNNWSDSWTEPYPRCAIPSDNDYRSDIITITYSVERTPSGFGASTLMTSNHTTGAQGMAISLAAPANQNISVANTLYFFCELPPRFDGPEGLSSLGSQVKLSHIKLTVGEESDSSGLLKSEKAMDAAAESSTVTVVKSVNEIRRLSNVAAGEQFAANVKGKVLNLHPNHSRVFIHDGHAGIYVELEKPASEFPGLRVGSMVRIEGVTLSGGFSPIIYTKESPEILGWQRLTRARKLNRTLYHSTRIDVDWVMLEGRPVSMEYVESYGHFLITMEVFDTRMEVFVPYSEDAYEKMKPYMFQQIRVDGVLGTTANRHQQMTGRILYINSVDDFRLMPELSGAVPRYFPMQELMQYGKESQGLVKTEGTIISAASDTLYLRGGNATLKAAIFQEERFVPGDQVELMGYARVRPVSPEFQAISVSRTGTGPRPNPLVIQLTDTGVDPGWNNELVRVEAEFVHVEKTFSSSRHGSVDQEGDADFTKEILWCRVGPSLFEVRMADGIAFPTGLRPGSRIQLTGICHVSRTKNPRLDSMANTMWMELYDKDALIIIRQASWWTTKRLLWGLGFMVMASFLFVMWVLALRKTVALQTNTIGEQVQRETLLNERQRIARELHDTLEQGLTALSLQLGRLYRKADQKNRTEDLPIVEKAIQTLQVCREESRASIQDLRGGFLEKMDLPSAIRKTLEPKLEETTIDLQVEVQGTGRRLTLFAEHQLLRMITEAASNAILHGAPSMILIRLEYGLEELKVLVKDDGCGFDLSVVEHSGRFGVMGMYERANRLNGTLLVESKKGVGTEIRLAFPIGKFIEEGRL